MHPRLIQSAVKTDFAASRVLAEGVQDHILLGFMAGASGPFSGDFHLLLSWDQDRWVSLPCSGSYAPVVMDCTRPLDFSLLFQVCRSFSLRCRLEFWASVFSASSYPLDISVITHLLLGSWLYSNTYSTSSVCTWPPFSDHHMAFHFYFSYSVCFSWLFKQRS